MTLHAGQVGEIVESYTHAIQRLEHDNETDTKLNLTLKAATEILQPLVQNEKVKFLSVLIGAGRAFFHLNIHYQNTRNELLLLLKKLSFNLSKSNRVHNKQLIRVF